MKKPISALKRFLEEGSEPLDIEMQSELEYTPAPEEVRREENHPTEEPGHIKNRRTANVLYTVSSVVLCALMIFILVYNVSGLPSFGGADTLIDSEVGRFYIENGLEDTGATNIITPIILSYRGFDTLGESHVLFIALCSVMLLLRFAPQDASGALRAYAIEEDEPQDDDILKSFGHVLLPLVFVFGLYIIFNGNLSPGGGFSGGAVLGAGFIMYLSIYGHDAAYKFFNYKTMKLVSMTALVSYSLFKGYHFITGYNGWESVFSNGTVGTIFSGGMLLYLNLFVGAVVSVTMYTLFVLFRRGDF